MHVHPGLWKRRLRHRERGCSLVGADFKEQRASHYPTRLRFSIARLRQEAAIDVQAIWTSIQRLAGLVAQFRVAIGEIRRRHVGKVRADDEEFWFVGDAFSRR